MNIIVLCVLIAGLQPLFWTLLSKAGGAKAGIPYDNRSPRECVASYSGWQKRAQWAQQNALEAFPFFAASIGFAWLAGTAQTTMSSLAMAFVVARFIYGFCYMANLHILRSGVWAVGWGITICLFVMAIK